MNYFYTNAPLDGVVPVNKDEELENTGLRKKDIILAIDLGFQQIYEGKVITLLPIYNEVRFNDFIKDRLLEDGKFYIFKIVTEEQAIKIRDEIIEKNKEKEIEIIKSPSENDLYRATIIKLLTEIKLGGNRNV